MRIFKIAKKAVALLILLSLCVLVEYGIGQVLTPVSYADYFKHDIESLLNEDENADMIFIGASRTYRSFVPEIFEERLGLENVINAGSSSQPYSASYYQLKDLLKVFTPKYVVLGVTGDKLVTEESTQGKLIVYDRLINAGVKISFGINCLEGKEKLYLLRSYRFREDLALSTIRANHMEKVQLVEDEYEPDKSGSEYYADKGFVYSYNTFEVGNIPVTGESNFSKENIVEKNIKWLDKIIGLCETEGIELYFVAGPTTMMRLYNIENYQEAEDFYTAYAEKHNLSYYNLNLLRSREELLPDSLMHDYNHVNGEGAEVISKQYADILKKQMNGEASTDLFYSSLEELKDGVERIVAVSADIETGNGKIILKIKSLQSNDVIPEYQVQVAVDGGEYTSISGYSGKTDYVIEIPEEGKIKIRIDARNSEKRSEAGAFQVYEYDLK